ncbi:MAG: M48 family metalloprotease [Acidimicrobiales bacterium]
MSGPTRTRPRRKGRGSVPDDRLRSARRAQQEAAYETARAVLARATARRDASWRRAAEDNRRRALVVLWSPLAIGVVVTVLGVLASALFIAGGLLLAAWIAAAALTWRGLAGREGAFSRAGSLAEVVASGSVPLPEARRFEDIVESLCGSLGLPPPELRVLEVPEANILCTGRDPGSACLIATVGLLACLDRIELEAVVAHELSHVKRLDVLTGTLAMSPLVRCIDVVFCHRLARFLIGADREVAADLAGVSVTRYPPGLQDALAKLRESKAPGRDASPDAERSSPDAERGSPDAERRSPDAERGSPGDPRLLVPASRLSLEDRLEVLREL